MRKAQMNAAVLIAILSALIVMYILFLPSDDRLDIIGDNYSDHGSGTVNGKKILVEDKEAVFEHVSGTQLIKDIPSLNLYTSTNAKVLREIGSVYVKNGVFDTKGQQVDFSLDNPGNSDNILISFFAKKAKGNLMITVNNHEVFSGKLNTVNVEPIRIPKEFLSTNNVVKVDVSGVGIAFWSTNEYQLDNFKITADVSDTSTQKADVSFVFKQSDLDNFERTRLYFVAECNPGSVGTLEIILNNRPLYNSVPDCGILRPLEFSPTALVSGENKLNFNSDRGRFIIDQIAIRADLREQPSYVYYFDLTASNIRDIQNKNKNVNLSISFVDDIEDKEAEIIVNNRKTYMRRHDDFFWSTNLDNFVEEGSNSLKIVPLEKLEVRKLQVVLQDD